MTSSNTLKKIFSIGAAVLLAVGSSLAGATPAQATPLINAKKMGYKMNWLPGQALETTFASPSVGFSSYLRMDDVTALRGTTLTVSSLNTGLPNGTQMMDYGYVKFYANTTHRDAGYPTVVDGVQLNSSPNSNLVVPQTAVAMSIDYTTRYNGDSERKLPAGSYTSTPRVFSNGVAIPVSTATSGSSIYTSSSVGEVDGATAAFTTPATGTVRSTSYYVLGCIDSSLLTSSTTYTATLKVNGVSASNSFAVSLLTGTSGNMNEVRGSSGSFSSGQLATWRQSGAEMQVLADNYYDSSNNALGTQYDAELEFKDGSNQSLLKDCMPTTPSGTGSFSFTSTGNSGMVTFTPDSTLGASAWGVEVFKASDDSVVSAASGMASASSMVYAPYTGGMGMPAWVPGTTIYARAVAQRTLLGNRFSSPYGPVSATFTVPAYGGVSAPAGNAPSVGATRPLSLEQAKNVLKPLPASVQPLVAAFPRLNKPMASNGGKIDLTEGNFTGLISATVAGKSLDFILGKTGQISMTVPKGEAGKTADLHLTFTSGKIIIQDAIKYVAPVVFAEVPVRPVSISAGASKLSEEAADQIRHAALANLKNTDISCVAYAVADTAAAKAAAKATATKACALAKKTNSDLTVAPITVVVDKLKARTQGVGIKVYKATN
jgi:hypothetical protein